MDALQKLVHFIEDPSTLDTEREKAISELNLLGKPSAEVEDEAFAYWKAYFEEHMEDILSEEISITSHLLSDEQINTCFQESFVEYKAIKKSQQLTKGQKFGYEGF